MALDRETLLIQPHPQPLSLDPRSWPLLPDLGPHAGLQTDEYKAGQRLVSPETIRSGALGRSGPVNLVVLPRFEPGSDTALAPLGRASTVVELVPNTFAFADHGRVALDLLATAARRAACSRLTTGGFEVAVEPVSGLAGASTAGRRAS